MRKRKEILKKIKKEKMCGKIKQTVEMIIASKRGENEVEFSLSVLNVNSTTNDEYNMNGQKR